MSSDGSSGRVVVRGVEVLSEDPAELRRLKFARIALDAGETFTALLDLEGHVLDVNQRALERAGLVFEHVSGSPLRTAFWWRGLDESQRTFEEALARAARGEFVRVETSLRLRVGDAVPRDVELSLTPITDDLGRFTFVRVDVREQAPRVREERAVLETRLVHAVLTQAPMFVAVLRGPEHVIELANPPMCERIWKRPESELLGRPLFDVMPELGQQALRGLLENVYRTGVCQLGGELPLQFERPGGVMETLHFDFVYAPHRDAEGRVQGIFVVASDVTAQAEARRHVSELRDAAESASRAKDEFFAMLGHELRNPLSPILTALHLMKQRGDPESARERTIIERQVNHLTRLVDDLLDVSRIARGSVELKMEVIEMAEVVSRASEMASPLLEQRNHTLAVDVEKHGLRVEGDVTRLCQVVANLLTNAAKYTPPGGTIAVRASLVKGQVVLAVRDTGIGIRADMLPRIFDLFVQERQALDRSQGGLGIGLTIVRNLVELHGGTVFARSEGVGEGSEFMVRLPVTTRDELQRPTFGARKTPEPQPSVAAVARILVVDDNEDGAEMLAEALARRNYDARVAHDGPSALRVAAEFAPHVAFLDIGLPVMDGYELAAHLRALPGLETMRLVAVTGYGQESDRRRTREAGFDQHLVKPVDLSAIEQALKTLLA